MAGSTVIYIGASRGCGFFALLEHLRTGGSAVLLLRKPDAFKAVPDYAALTDAERGRVTVVTGDAHNIQAMKRLLEAAPNASAVVFSIGAFPTWSWSKLWFEFLQPEVCRGGMRTLLQALRETPNVRPPRLVMVSTTGLGSTFYRLPYAWRPLYAMSLMQTPHLDKEITENIAFDAVGLEQPFDEVERVDPPSKDRLFKELVIVRCALLTDGAAKGLSQIRAERELTHGYTISRRDAGLFVANALKDDTWVGGSVEIAY